MNTILDYSVKALKDVEFGCNLDILFGELFYNNAP